MRRMFINLATFAVLSLNIAFAQAHQPVTLKASDGMTLDQFATAAAVDGNFAIIGAPRPANNGVESGTAYIFRNDVTTWTEVAKLTASDAAAGDQFGFSVAIQGNYVVVGAPEKDDVGSHSGAVYVFQQTGNTWVETAKLSSTNIAQDSHFGWSVSIDGDYVAAGATGTDKQHPGLVHIFQRDGNTWPEVTNFFTPDIGEGDNFGSSLSLSGDYVIVGDENYPAGEASGAAYIFKRNGTSWTNVAKIIASDGSPGDQFGWSVSIDRDFAIVSAVGDDDAGDSSGSAYVFQRIDSTWMEIAKLTASDGVIGGRFGWSASLHGNFVVVGAIGPDSVTPGAAYVFQRSNANWSEIAKLTSPDIGEGDLFGGSVSITDEHIVVGDKNFPAGAATGAAYVFIVSLLPLGIDVGASEIPTGFFLDQNYPNPFNPGTTIKFSLPHTSFVTLKIYSLLGEEVATLVAENLLAGKYQIEWDASGFSSGVYYYRMQSDKFVEAKKFTLLK